MVFVNQSYDILNEESLKKMEHRFEFYLTIYPETQAHVDHFVCGSGLDLGLNAVGLDAAKKLSRRFRKNPFSFTEILAGPELRCIQTADLIHDVLKVKFRVWADLRDQFMGDLEGQPFQGKVEEDFPPRGENRSAFQSRVFTVAQRLKAEAKVPLVVTHLRVARLLADAFSIVWSDLEPGRVYHFEVLTQGHGKIREV